ncbi:MAG TPA: phosphoribosylaminoimidazolesuccinocarboxamide synthase [Candidatus Baltobacteraceae bacterium]|jgi:phosphoribosylaminoimidazole-succinocarboxamide synthase|nr:phosphoribosylaminoimidazolesuccinocarboxamide synthase [Candidatus Baltobacteraceae bacterium]
MNKGREVARGKTKILFESPNQPNVLVLTQTDAITAQDGLRRHEIPGKGRLAARTNAHVFRLLNLCGVPTHFVSGGEDDDDNETLVRRCTMLPLEVVVRGVAAGSLLKRNPGLQKGSIIFPRLVEFFLKDDANHDPLISPEEVVRRGIATPTEIGAMTELARMAYDILAHAWRRRDTILVDLKIEFGRLVEKENEGALVLADVVDNDSWRIWPQGREDLMLDKQVYRNLTEVSAADLERIRSNYEQVADLTGTFPQMRSGMIALIADGPENVAQLDPIAHAFSQFGLPTIRRVASARLMPGYAMQLVQQLDVTFPRLVYVPVAGRDLGLAAMIEASTSSPVVSWSGGSPDATALASAKAFALDDTVMFGRVLLVQANARSGVLHADSQLAAPENAPQPIPVG